MTRLWSRLQRLPAMVCAIAVLTVPGFQPIADGGDLNPETPTATDEAFQSDVLPIVQKYCLDCHGSDGPEGDVSLDTLDNPTHVIEDRDTWVRALRLLSVDGMPPKDYDERPSPAERQKMVDWLDVKLFHVDCDVADDSGRVTIHRLNRTEYSNTICDLFGVKINPAEDFPSDNVGYGFSNIADVLSMPPLLFEKYVDASETIAAATILTNEGGRPVRRFDADQLKTTGSAQSGGDWVRMNSNGSAVRSQKIEIAGDYIIRVEAQADQAGPDPARMEIRVDGVKVTVHDIKGHRQPATYEVNCRLEQGQRKIEAAFINDYYKPDAKDPMDRDRNMAVQFIEIEGPTDAPPPEVHRRIVFTRPDDAKSVELAAGEIFGRLLPLAFRRTVEDAEVNRFVRLVKFAVDRGDSFERGVQAGLQAVLVSPHFLFRIEYDDATRGTITQHSVSDFELASRLSYFLWSTMPDDELFRLAEQGKLHEPAVLNAQVDRMLSDPKADALVDNFASQWLTLSNIVEAQPSQQLFPEFTSELRADMVQETKAFVRSVFRGDLSLLSFIDADFTFVNERLAKHYGINGVEGAEFRRVSLPKDQRVGVLTHASILTITSNPDRTSLVRRGVWILDQILGMELPDPPGDVPSLEDGAKESGATSMREQLKIHREMPTCAVCHDTMDPLGFGFENFDPIGRWRVEAEGQPVDAGGMLPSGESFSGPVELAAILRDRKDEFAELVTRKMLTYALGRGLEIPDSCAVDEIVDDLKKNDYRFTVLVHGIVRSKPFLMRRDE
jgi:Protein of unknown function (DUF1592)/Protein of unknown function (DUF1588)/Protein of unknown function (DUF1585)/Protein of unknown function (DUF1587)/Protein of unknown function (DUF1595)/Ca-dependent carbohydrate-binding module xylan-binding/Planctomycete cytochrome C